MAYEKDGALPDDRMEASKIQHMATWYILIEDILYKKFYSISTPSRI